MTWRVLIPEREQHEIAAVVVAGDPAVHVHEPVAGDRAVPAHHPQKIHERRSAIQVLGRDEAQDVRDRPLPIVLAHGCVAVTFEAVNRCGGG